MRKGWKTRMDERKYFEDKQIEREARIEFMKITRIKIQRELEQMKNEVPFGSLYETH